MTMNIVTEPKLAGQPVDEKGRARPVRKVRWFAIVGLLLMFDAPEQGDLLNFKAQATVAQLQLERAKQLASRQFGPQATADQAQATYDQAMAGIAKTEAIISQKLVRAPFEGDLGVRMV